MLIGHDDKNPFVFYFRKFQLGVLPKNNRVDELVGKIASRDVQQG